MWHLGRDYTDADLREGEYDLVYCEQKELVKEMQCRLKIQVVGEDCELCIRENWNVWVTLIAENSPRDSCPILFGRKKKFGYNRIEHSLRKGAKMRMPPPLASWAFSRRT